MQKKDEFSMFCDKRGNLKWADKVHNCFFFVVFLIFLKNKWKKMQDFTKRIHKAAFN